MKWNRIVATIMSVGFTFALGFIGGCSSGGEGNSAVLMSKCAQMCEHFLAAPLSACGKVFANAEACQAECYDHVTTPQSDGKPQADEGDLDCAITAPTCEAWNACGDLL